MKQTIWRNKKNGRYYRVLTEAIDCTNERDGLKVFVYQSLGNEELTFVRSEEEFRNKFIQEDYAIWTKVHEEGGRFEILEEGEVLAELDFNFLDDQTLDAYHTFVDQRLRGKGIADKLYQALLRYAKEHDFKITASCSYIEERLAEEEK